MSPIIWDASLETGDEVIDRQHRAIHALFNQLEAAADNEAEIMRALDFLTEHVAVHFAMEEDLMRSEEFPPRLTEAHVFEHERLTEGVRDQVLAFRTGQLDSMRPIVDFMREWLVTHVRQCDRQFIEHISARGVAAQLPDAWFEAERRARV